jgi:hypothetical protein
MKNKLQLKPSLRAKASLGQLYNIIVKSLVFNYFLEGVDIYLPSIYWKTQYTG